MSYIIIYVEHGLCLLVGQAGCLDLCTFLHINSGGLDKFHINTIGMTSSLRSYDSQIGL